MRRPLKFAIPSSYLIASRRSLLILQLTRPIFLAGGWILFSLGTAIAWKLGFPLNGNSFWVGLAMVSSIQLSAQYANEYFDREVDLLLPEHRTWFSGGSGVLSGGEVQPKVALRASLIFSALALVAVAFVSTISLPAALVGLAALAGSWLYSARPLALVSSGFGELEASLIVAVLVPMVGFLMQAHSPLPRFLWLICLPLLLIHAAMLMVLGIPDQFADLAAGKRTLVVRSGINNIALLHAGLVIAAYGLFALLPVILEWNLALVWLTFPLAVFQVVSVVRIAKAKQAGGRWLTFRAVALFALSALFLLFSLVVLKS